MINVRILYSSTTNELRKWKQQIFLINEKKKQIEFDELI